MTLEISRRALETVYHQHNGAPYLTPSNLEVQKTSLRRVLLVGSCTAERWRDSAERYLGCTCDFVLTNNLASLPSRPPSDPSTYDFAVIQIHLRSVLADQAFWTLPYNDIASHETLFSATCARLSAQLASLMGWSVHFGILAFVSNFMVPQANPLGRLMPRYDCRNPVHFVEKLNQFLDSEIRKYRNCYPLDLDEISASLGRRHVQEDSFGWIAHNGYLPHNAEDLERIEKAPPATEYYESRVFDAIKSLWPTVTAMYRTIRQLDAVKLVVVDLDDTLWSGIAAETNQVGSFMIEEPSWPMGIIEALAFLKKRGILLAIISKNDAGLVRELWRKIVGPKMDMDDFAICRINWSPKVDNMREILQAFNLLPRNVVFVDDNPVERSAMISSFPDIRTLPGQHYYWRRILLWSSETQLPSITEESTRRTEMVRSQVERENQKSEMTRQEFLASLDLKASLTALQSVNDGDFVRVFELLNKTNQFNTTGKRWTQEECARAFDRGATFYYFSAEDRFTNYGIVGVVIIVDNRIAQYVMSCRVAGLDLELAILGRLINALASSGHGEIVADFVDTRSNFLCRDFLSKLAFKETGSAFTLDSATPCVAPGHVQLSFIQR
jgi:FkbH-like protein